MFSVREYIDNHIPILSTPFPIKHHKRFGETHENAT